MAKTTHNQATTSGSAYPDFADLLEKVHFAHHEGRIWLDQQRMVLMHTSALGVLRAELIESLGINSARGLLTRIGYNSGARDARLTASLRGQLTEAEAISSGAQLHMLEGMARVEPVRLEVDVASGHFYGEFLWYGSAEDEEHTQRYGIGVEPACWMQVGYASGFASVFVGKPVLFREVSCASQGEPHCRIIGKPVDAWQDVDHELSFLSVDALTSGLTAARFAEEGVAEDDMGDGGQASLRPLPDPAVVGASAGFNAVCHMLRRVASSQATVLLLGESGVGKEVLARALHRISPRAAKPFIALNCAAIPNELIEAELFGVERGAYTGATAGREGRFERADGGTLFLDEIGNMAWTAQGKLLRALQEREIERVGDIKVRKVDVRVVAATNLDLREEVRQGRFREDLFYRLNVFPVRVPPLRERREDIPIFMNHFLRKFCERDGKAIGGFTARAVDAMLSYDWPGNVRELENLIERGVILAPEQGTIDIGHLFLGGEEITDRLLSIGGDGRLHRTGQSGDSALQAKPGDGLQQQIDALLSGSGLPDAGGEAATISLVDIENRLIESAVRQSAGNLSAAARLLGISRPKLDYRMKTRGI